VPPSGSVTNATKNKERECVALGPGMHASLPFASLTASTHWEWLLTYTKKGSSDSILNLCVCATSTLTRHYLTPAVLHISLICTYFKFLVQQWPHTFPPLFQYFSNTFSIKQTRTKQLWNESQALMLTLIWKQTTHILHKCIIYNT